MKIVFAIGNPGIEYKYTYHNLGILFTDFLIQKSKILYQKRYQNSLFIKTENYNIAQSCAYVNLSYTALKEIIKYNKIEVEDIIVVHDDLNIKKFTVKIGQTEGSGGHNGIRDIQNNIGSKYIKLKLGIGHPKEISPEQTVREYVLSKLKIEEWQNTFKEAESQLREWI